MKNKAFRAEQLGLLEKDIVHNPHETSFKEFLDNQYSFQQINDVFSDNEINFLVNFFFKNVSTKGYKLFDSLKFILYPLNFEKIREIIYGKITDKIGSFWSYYDINKDSVHQSSDFFMYQTKIFMPHTDSITHIKGFVPYRDIIIPLAIDKDINSGFYICNQRWYGRSSHLKFGCFDNYVTNYSNIFRCYPYENYGIENVTYDSNISISSDWLNENIGNELEHSIFNGLSIEKEFSWLPGSIIIQNPACIHGPKSYLKKGAKWKLGITIRAFQKNDKYFPNTLYSQYEPIRAMEKSNG